MPKLKIQNIDELEQVAANFWQQIEKEQYIAFSGDLGAGKTTFIKALCSVLEVEDSVTSPTFAIVNEYYSKTVGTIFHFDFYRIKNEIEILDIGFEDYINQDAIVLMEWPEKTPNILPEETLIVNISVLENGERILSW